MSFYDRVDLYGLIEVCMLYKIKNEVEIILMKINK